MDPVLVDKSKKPTPARLSRVLGRTQRHWREIVAHAERACEGVSLDWKFYGPKYGWTCKLTWKRKALLYLAPRHGTFTASMALKGEALARLRDSRVPADLVAEIKAAKAWPEGKPARVDVTNPTHVKTVQRLVDVKRGP